MNYWAAWIGFNFYDYSDFQQKIRGCYYMKHPVGVFILLSESGLARPVQDETTNHIDRRS